jgi:hypothetical protein
VVSAIGIVPLQDWRIDLTHTYAVNKYLGFISGTANYSGHTMSVSPGRRCPDCRRSWSGITSVVTTPAIRMMIPRASSSERIF